MAKIIESEIEQFAFELLEKQGGFKTRPYGTTESAMGMAKSALEVGAGFKPAPTVHVNYFKTQDRKEHGIIKRKIV